MFSESSTDQNDIFCVSADFFGRLLWRTSELKILIASTQTIYKLWKSLIPATLFKKLVPALR